MIEKVTEAMVAIEGEAMRHVTWVRVQETGSGEWAIGGKPLTTAAVKAMAAARCVMGHEAARAALCPMPPDGLKP